MPKIKSVFVCQNCGAQYSKWQGQCTQCGQWNTLVEEMQQQGTRSGRPASAKSFSEAKVVRWSEIETRGKKPIERFGTGSDEFDRVLGGGIVPGSVVLIAGEPGMGKSTLLTQLALNVRANHDSPLQNTVLYVCGEESVEQVGLRVNRITRLQRSERSDGGQDGKPEKPEIAFLPTTDVDVIVETSRQEKPRVLIVDSIQTLSTEDLTGMAGSVGQVRETASRLVRLAKDEQIAVFVVGHVTKEGSVAGPKVLEHMVDAVVEITGERSGLYRLLRNLKNRFGATDEVGVMEMQESGLIDVANPSGAFLEELEQGVPGRAVVVAMEGTRPVLVEVQALAVHSNLPQPRRVAQGISLAKLQVLTAVLQKWCGLKTYEYDVFVSVVGGLKLTDPGADAGIALAIAGSVLGKALPEKLAAIGEVGLLGEIRRVPFLEKRIKEAKRLGYEEVVAPPKQGNLRRVVMDFLHSR
jgi:DNA repair protein RadA/Sms